METTHPKGLNPDKLSGFLSGFEICAEFYKLAGVKYRFA